MTVSAAIDGKVGEHAMLKHPFYQAWTEGRLSLDTLRAYARQYFHHVEAFPQAVSAVHASCPDRGGRRMLAENLAEEEGVEAGKQDHASLWLMFACGLGEREDAVRAQRLNPAKQPLTLTEPLTRRVHAGRPVNRAVAGPEPSTLAELLTFAATVALPSAPIVASLAESPAASRLEMPRTTAVSFAACPARVALAVPTTETLS